jgi:hypothetical protein
MSSERNMDLQPLVSFLGIIVSILLNVIAYQWNKTREQGKTLRALGLLIQEPGVIEKIYLHMKMDDPVAAAEERLELEKRVAQLEDIIKLMVVKRDKARTLQRLIEDRVRDLR